MNHPAVAVIAFALLVPGVAGCGQATEQAVEQIAEEALSSAGAEVDIEEGKVTVTGPSGEAVSVGEGVDLPDNWPADVPVPDGTLMGVSVDQANGTAWAMWQLPAGTPEPVAAYKSALESGGFTVTSETSTSGMTVLTAEGNAQQVEVVGGDVDGELSLTVSVSSQE